MWGQDVKVGRGASRTLSEDRHAVWVPSEVVDVVLNPAKCESLILEAVVPGHHRVLR